jgi:hypothetical protein
MSELVAKASDALSPFGPVVQAFFIVMIAFVSFMAMRRGEKDRKDGLASVEVPMFLMGGPVSDAIGAIHDIAEESRATTMLLRGIADGLGEANRNMVKTHMLLEAIYNAQEMRPPPVRQR